MTWVLAAVALLAGWMWLTKLHALWIHPKVYLAWGKWWAFQFVRKGHCEISVGLRYNYERHLVDLYLGPLTFAWGRHAVYSDPRTREWNGCRGMLFPDNRKFPFPEDQTPFEARVL